MVVAICVVLLLLCAEGKHYVYNIQRVLLKYYVGTTGVDPRLVVVMMTNRICKSFPFFFFDLLRSSRY